VGSPAATAASLADGDVLGSVVGMAGYLTAIALLGLAIGILLRSVASSIAVLVAGIMILPGLAGALLSDSWDTVLKYLPEQAAASFTSVGSSSDAALSATGGAIVLEVGLPSH
jgi:ABC-2 type transport system permease protein